MAQFTYKVEELKRIIRESQNEFKPVLGPNVESDNKKNSDKFYKDSEKRAKDYDGGLKEPKKEPLAKSDNINRTMLGLNPVAEPSKEYKDRVKAQVQGYNSTAEKNNKIEKSGEFDRNKDILKNFSDQEDDINDAKTNLQKAGLVARELPEKDFKKNTVYENKLVPKRLNFKHTTFVNEAQMLMRIPEEYKKDGQIIYMSDAAKNEYIVECSYSKKSGLMETNVIRKSNKLQEQKQLNRISELMGYSSSKTFGSSKPQERINESESFQNMMDLARKNIIES